MKKIALVVLLILAFVISPQIKATHMAGCMIITKCSVTETINQQENFPAKFSSYRINF